MILNITVGIGPDARKRPGRAKAWVATARTYMNTPTKEENSTMSAATGTTGRTSRTSTTTPGMLIDGELWVRAADVRGTRHSNRNPVRALRRALDTRRAARDKAEAAKSERAMHLRWRRGSETTVFDLAQIPGECTVLPLSMFTGLDLPENLLVTDDGRAFFNRSGNGVNGPSANADADIPAGEVGLVLTSRGVLTDTGFTREVSDEVLDRMDLILAHDMDSQGAELAPGDHWMMTTIQPGWLPVSDPATPDIVPIVVDRHDEAFMMMFNAMSTDWVSLRTSERVHFHQIVDPVLVTRLEQMVGLPTEAQRKAAERTERKAERANRRAERRALRRAAATARRRRVAAAVRSGAQRVSRAVTNGARTIGRLLGVAVVEVAGLAWAVVTLPILLVLANPLAAVLGAMLAVAVVGELSLLTAWVGLFYFLMIALWLKAMRILMVVPAE